MMHGSTNIKFLRKVSAPCSWLLSH